MNTEKRILLNQFLSEYNTAMAAYVKAGVVKNDPYSAHSDDYSVYKAGQKSSPEKDLVDFLFNRICMLNGRDSAMEIYNKHMVK
jgi:hypothetical protein